MKTNEYRLIEYMDDDDFVIARVTMCKDEIVSIEIIEDYRTNKEELTNLKKFIDEISSSKWKFNTDDEETADWYDVTPTPTHTHEIKGIPVETTGDSTPFNTDTPITLT